jgi:hypothetical protein
MNSLQLLHQHPFQKVMCKYVKSYFMFLEILKPEYVKSNSKVKLFQQAMEGYRTV